MAHGTPDYAITNALATVYRMNDLGELAVRLGSPVAFDRRGDVLWWDDFECGIAKWTATLAGTGAAVAVDETHPYNGSQAVKLTAGSDGDQYAQIAVALPLPVFGRHGLEVSFGTLDEPDQVEMYVFSQNAAQQVGGALRWNNATNTLEYFNSASGWTSLGALSVWTSAPFGYHTMKLVFDRDTGLYARAIFDSQAFDLSAIAANVTAGAPAPNMRITIKNVGRAGVNDAIYVDDVIATRNEP